MNIFVLDTNLFPEKQLIEDALAELEADHEITRRAASAELADEDWDLALKSLLSADRVITL